MTVPKWTDSCGHCNNKDDKYIGTYTNHNGTYDVYLYEGILGTMVCIRYGNDAPEYISIGTLAELFRLDYVEAQNMVLEQYTLTYKARGKR